MSAGPVVFPMTSAQQRMWTMERLVPGTAAYHLPLAFRLRGRVRADDLERAVHDVIARHDALRTAFVEAEGRAVQMVHPEVSFRLDRADLDSAGGGSPEAVGRFLVEAAARPFELTRPPLVRGWLARVADDDHVLLLVVHHLVADMWSLGLLLHEVAARYNGGAGALPALPIQYGDVAIWESRRRDGQALRTLADHWRDVLRAAPAVLPVPTDRHRPSAPSLSGADLMVSLGRDQVEAVEALAADLRATSFMVIMAAYAVMLGAQAQQTDVVVCTGVSNRPPLARGVIGCFFNLVPIRVSLAGEPSFAEVVRRVRTAALDAFEHQDLPFETLVAELAPRRALSHPPIAQHLFILQGIDPHHLELSGVQAQLVPVPRRSAQLDLSLHLWPNGRGELAGFLEYDTELFDPDTVSRLQRQLVRALAQGSSRPDAAIGALELGDPEDRQRALVTMNDSLRDHRADRCVHELVQEQATAQPTAVAIVHGERRITYAELLGQADLLAARLLEAGAGPDQVVALVLPRGVDLVTAMLAAMRAGGAYLPIDPDYPADRIGFMLADAAPVAVVVDPRTRAAVPDGAGPVIVTAAAGPSGPPRPLTVRGADPHHLAYVMYTSGSTGRPKRIALAHRGVVNNLLDFVAIAGVAPGQALIAMTSPSFDISVYDVLGTLVGGGTIVLPTVEEEHDPAAWVRLIHRHGVSIWNTAPVLAEQLLATVGAGDLPGLRSVMIGGDWVPLTMPERFREVAPAAVVTVLYGVTEASVYSAALRVDGVRPAWTTIPAGSPMSNQTVVVLERWGRIAPVGVEGEIHIGGLGLARGYAGQPALTADRFVPAAFAGEFAHTPEGARLYRTGDRGRYTPSGEIELLGRNDHQIKIRGLRVEPAEIAVAMERHPAVERAMASLDERSERGPRLVGYFVMADGQSVTTPELRQHLTETLPAWMIPSAFSRLERLPVTANGKVDPAQLARIEPEASNGPPTANTDVERVIAGLWAMILRSPAPRGDEHFFDRGGDSLLVIRLANHLKAIFQVDVALRELFVAGTVPEQADLVVRKGRAAAVDIAQIAATAAMVQTLDNEAVEQALRERGRPT